VATLALAGLAVAVDEAGGGPAVVFGHAGICDRTMWDDQWDALAPAYRAVRFDRPGAGASPAVDAPYDHAALLEALLDRLEIERAVLVGASMGGSLSVDFALAHPDRVAGLVLVCSGCTGPDVPLTAAEAAVGPLYEAARDAAAMVDIDLGLWVDGPDRPGRADERLRERVRAMDLVCAQHEFAHPEGRATWREANAADRLSGIRVPALVVTAPYDPPMSRARSEILATGLPRAQRLVMDGCAHLPSMEAPDRFNRALLALLAGLSR